MVPPSKIYDGTTNASPTGTPALSAAENPGTGDNSDGLSYTGDEVNITGLPSAGYDNADVNTASTVSFGIGTLTLSGAQSGDYSITVQGAVAATITPAPLTVMVESSENPSVTGAGVHFMASVNPVVAGSIVFATNNAPFDTKSLASGSATSASTSLLPVGNNSVTATYTGNPDYSGSGAIFGGQVVNSSPAGPPVLRVSVSAGQVQISFNGLADDQYILQRSTDAVTWVSINTNSASSNTTFTVTDTFPDLGAPPASAYYRVLTP
jgi:hypothetical protein